MISEILVNSSVCYYPAHPVFQLSKLDVQYYKIKEVIIPAIHLQVVNDSNNTIVLTEEELEQLYKSNAHQETFQILPQGPDCSLPLSSLSVSVKIAGKNCKQWL